MSTPAFDWNDIPLLLALARAGSMSAASRQLGVETSTISRRLAAAETALQTRLFIRSNQGYQPTDAGQAFIEHGERVVGGIEALLQATRAEADGVGGVVRITAVNVLFDYWLTERLHALLAEYPQLQVTLLADNQNLSFTRREADFALRLAQPTEDAAILMRKVGEVGFAVYGSEAHAKLQREDWARQPWLAYGDELAQLPEMRWLRERGLATQPLLKVSNLTTLAQACATGLGLAILPRIIGERSGLRRLGEADVRREVWLLSHRDAAKIRRFRVVADWLGKVFEEGRGVLAG